MKKNTLITLICLSAVVINIALANAQKANTTKNKIVDRLYNSHKDFTGADKQIMLNYDFIDWPRDNIKPVKPLNFVKILEDFGATAKPKKNLNSNGLQIRWKYNGCKGKLKIAVYPNRKEAQLHLLEKLMFCSEHLQKGKPWETSGLGDVSLYSNITSELFFLRNNVCVYSYVKVDGNTEATKLQSNLCKLIDAAIQEASLLTTTSGPFHVKKDRITDKEAERLLISVTPINSKISFSIACMQLHGPKLKLKLPTSKVTSDKTRVCEFSGPKVGDLRVKVFVCEESGMVWTYYVQ